MSFLEFEFAVHSEKSIIQSSPTTPHLNREYSIVLCYTTYNTEKRCLLHSPASREGSHALRIVTMAEANIRRISGEPGQESILIWSFEDGFPIQTVHKRHSVLQACLKNKEGAIKYGIASFLPILVKEWKSYLI